MHDMGKKTNDKYGHMCGDEVLESTAATIDVLVRVNDIVSRWGGEELIITVTLGIAASSDHDESLDNLIEQADHAMYIGKSNGKNQCVMADY